MEILEFTPLSWDLAVHLALDLCWTISGIARQLTRQLRMPALTRTDMPIAYWTRDHVALRAHNR